MLERARQVFLVVYLCRQGTSEFPLPVSDLDGELAEALRSEIASQAARGVSLEFRNLCVRKADLVLVRNYRDSSRDELAIQQENVDEDSSASQLQWFYRQKRAI